MKIKKNYSKLIKQFLLTAALFFICITFIIYPGCRKEEVELETFMAKKGDIIDIVSVTGNVDSMEKRNYTLVQSAKVMHALSQGQSFEKGQVLIKIDESKIELYIFQAEQNLELAKKSLELAKINYQSALDSNHIAVQLAEANNNMADQGTINAFRALENARILGSSNINAAYDAMETAEHYLNIARNSPFSTDLAVSQAEASLSSATSNYRIARESARSQSGAAEGAYEQALINQSITYWNTLNSLQVASAQIKLMKKNIEQAEIQLELSNINLSLTSLELENFQIAAPFDGIVLSANFETGEMAGPGVPAISIISNDFIIKSDINENDIVKMSVGQEVIINVDAYPEKNFSGRIIDILPVSKNIAGIVTFEVKVKPENDAADFLRYGFSTNLTITVFELKDVLYVPVQAVYVEDGNQYVDLLTPEGDIIKTLIKTGGSNYDYIEILSGISEGDIVILTDI